MPPKLNLLGSPQRSPQRSPQSSSRNPTYISDSRTPPTPWVVRFSRTVNPGIPYYFNSITNETQWEFPENSFEADELNLREARLREARLDEASLREASVDEALLRLQAYLPEARLGESRLGESRLGESRLGEAVVDEASLRESRLGEASLGEASLREARLGEAVVDEASLREARLQARLREASLRRLRESEVVVGHLREARLGESRLGESRLREERLQAYLREARLREARLGEARLGEARLGEARLAGPVVRLAVADEASLGEARLGEARLRFLGEARLAGPVFSLAVADEASLGEARLGEARLRLGEARLAGPVVRPAVSRGDSCHALATALERLPPLPLRSALPGEIRNPRTGQLEREVADPVVRRSIFADALARPNLDSNLTDHINNMNKRRTMQELFTFWVSQGYTPSIFDYSTNPDLINGWYWKQISKLMTNKGVQSYYDVENFYKNTPEFHNSNQEKIATFLSEVDKVKVDQNGYPDQRQDDRALHHFFQPHDQPDDSDDDLYA